MPTVTPCLAERGGQVERAGKLVRLHADQHDHAGARLADRAGNRCRADALVGLVDGDDLERDVRSEHLPLGAIDGEAIEAGERIRRDRRAEPLDDVAVVVVVRRLDQDEPEAALGLSRVVMRSLPSSGTSTSVQPDETWPSGKQPYDICRRPRTPSP